MSVNEIREFIFENFYKRIVFSRENSYYLMKRLKRNNLLLLANKLTEKIPDQSEKVSSSSSLYSDKKSENFLNEKNIKITEQKHAFIGYVSTYNVEILNSFNPELQFIDIDSAIESKLIELLTQLKGFKFVTTLVLVFKKIESEDKTKYDTFYSNSKAGVFTNESNIDDTFQSIYTTIISNIQKSLGKEEEWTIDSMIDHTISIPKIIL